MAFSDTTYKPLLVAISYTNVYILTNPDESKKLVIAGPEVEKDGETLHPLFNPLPYQVLRKAQGDTLYGSVYEMEELEVGRLMRVEIAPLLTVFDLSHPDPQKRKSAALLLGESGDTLQAIPVARALEKETDPMVIHMMQEALLRLDLLRPSPSLRLETIRKLGELPAVNAQPPLVLLIDSTSTESEEVKKVAALALSSIRGHLKWTEFLQTMFSSLSLGSILILMALGLSVIFGLMGVINMAHGEFMMIGAYATFVTQNIFLSLAPGAFDWFLAFSFPISFFVAGAIGMLLEMTVIKKLYGRPLETLLATWGISLLLIQTARHIFGDLTAVQTPKLLSLGWEIYPQVFLPYNRIFIIFLTFFIVGGMALLFYRTPLGRRIRAVTQNRSMSACLGVRTRRLDCLTFGLGTGIAGIAGCALTQIGNVDPGMGQNYIVDSFMVVVTGGVGKLMGTVLAGMGIGTLNKFLEPIFQAVYAKVILLGLVILFLQWRPSGLFPNKGRNADD
jgi:urea transport system permease protein